MKNDMNRKKVSMKFMVSMFSTLFILTALLLFSGCGDNTTEPESERVKKLLIAGEWSVQNVNGNAIDLTSVYKNLKLTFKDGTFTSSGGEPIWPSSGSWSFTDTSAKKISAGNLEITIIEVTDKKFSYSLPWTKTTVTGGRIESIPGDITFVMAK
jgi:hypothetical protein